MCCVSARLSLCPDCQVPEVAKYQKYTWTLWRNTVDHIWGTWWQMKWSRLSDRQSGSLHVCVFWLPSIQSTRNRLKKYSWSYLRNTSWGELILFVCGDWQVSKVAKYRQLQCDKYQRASIQTLSVWPLPSPKLSSSTHQRVTTINNTFWWHLVSFKQISIAVLLRRSRSRSRTGLGAFLRRKSCTVTESEILPAF